uniref:ABC transporter domain-containing protein n=1 Tax=Picocystis salinarum TaxID=88271 RepID=A0A7S3UDR3_9CHLO|mmetsp:Transcript_799/g.4998  ORF Transcript_799/g.4998 Transcript_799/m.4998 type:complete len:1365 (+) Transcript_799:201-4295(+)
MDAWTALKTGIVGDDGLEWQIPLRREREWEELEAFRRLSTTEAKKQAADLAKAGLFKDLVEARRTIVEALEMAPPTVEVKASHLTVRGQALVGNERIPNVWSSFKNSLLGLFKPQNTQSVVLLNDVSVLLKPGESTLLLGPPGAGKSVLLQMLSDAMVSKEDLQVEGDITYNGKLLNEFVPRTTSAYVDQNDDHIAILSVRETFRFASSCSGNPILDCIGESIEKKQKEDPALFKQMAPVIRDMVGNLSSGKFREEVVLQTLGLSTCADTVVGDGLLRGISGGEKKRVTTGEMIVSTRRVLFLDEISTGLDSATTYSVAESLVFVTHKFRLTSLISLLQPPPETYDLFDNIILLAQGHLLYHGPREGTLPFFSSLGFVKPEEVDVADFLQQVTTPAGQRKFFVSGKHTRPTEGVEAGSQDSLIMSLQEIQRAFYNCEAGKELLESLNDPVTPSCETNEGLAFRKYTLGFGTLFTNVLSRWITMVVRDKKLWIAKLFQNIVLGIILGTLFYNLHVPNDFVGFFGVIFSSVMFMSFGNMPQMVLAHSNRSVFFKQRDANFYPASSYVLSAAVVYLPYALLDTIIFSSIVYFMVGFSTDGAGYFFTFCLLIFSQASCMSALFRMVGNISPTMVHANAYGGAVLLILIAMSGFTIVRTSIPDYWIWAYYASPYAYAIRALVINEMTSPRWGETNDGETVGETVLLSFGFFTDRIWIWIGVLALWVFYFIFTMATSLILSRVSGPKKYAFVPDKVAPRSGPVGFSASKDFPMEPLVLSFEKIRYLVPMPGNPKENLELLKGVSGYAVPGTLTALMGSSGAGKTTLMDVIAGRKTGGQILGEIKLNGHPKEQKTFRRIMGYVEQTDIHSPLATVREAFQYSAALRLPDEVSFDRRNEFVESMLALVELETLGSQIVGLPLEGGLSPEQRKKLTIGVELVANPSVIFMDEPTSGLDSNAASVVMKAVKNIGESGRTIICTIHQPSKEIFYAFDSLLLLQRGGRTIFFGDLGSGCSKLIAYLEGVPGTAPYSKAMNPANWMLEVSGIKEGRTDFAEAYDSSPLKQANEEKLAEYSVPQEGTKPVKFNSEYATSNRTQYFECLKKNAKTYWRSPAFNTTRYVMTFVIALIYGSVYWDEGSDPSTATDVQNIIGALYSSTVFLGVFNMLTIQPIISRERTVFYRERAAGTYAVVPYALALQVVEIPYLAIQAILYVCTVYFMIGFANDVGKFFFFLLVNFLNLWFLTMFGIFLVNITPTQQLASLVGASFLQVWVQFCGFVRRQPDIPAGWIWMYWITPLSYTLYALAVSQLGDSSTLITLEIGGEEPVSQFLENSFGFEYSFRWWCVLILFAFMLFFRFGSIVALLRLNFSSR